VPRSRRSLPFEPGDGVVRVALEPVVRGLVRQLVGEVAALLGPPPEMSSDPLMALLGAEPQDRPEDPALLRLLPDAYACEVDGGDAAREFRRLTDADLRATKRADAECVLATVDASTLDVDAAQSWLRALNDLRLVLGERLGLSLDGEAQQELDALAAAQDRRSPDEESRLALLQVYEHFALLVELLVESLDVLDPPVVRDNP
jgi:hypothetical protein